RNIFDRLDDVLLIKVVAFETLDLVTSLMSTQEVNNHILTYEMLLHHLGDNRQDVGQIILRTIKSIASRMNQKTVTRFKGMVEERTIKYAGMELMKDLFNYLSEIETGKQECQ
ncbi:MAG: hypothetical protein EZS28_052696, partial [Streblomastix strix]